MTSFRTSAVSDYYPRARPSREAHSIARSVMERAIAILLLIAGDGCSPSSERSAAVRRTPDTSAGPAFDARPRGPEPDHQIVLSPFGQMMTDIESASSLSQAVTVARPGMGPSMTDHGDGTDVLARWAAEELTWRELAAVRQETTLNRVLHDPETEVGKRLCVSGVLRELTGRREDRKSLHTGKMDVLPRGHLHVFAAGAAGPLRGGRRARLCGIVTGTCGVPPAVSIDVVGMFDIPANRTARAASRAP